MTDPSEPVAILKVSAPRRVFGFAVQAGLGVVLIVVALRMPEPSIAGVAVLLALGALALWQSVRMFRATSRDIVLTREGVYDSAGEVIAPLDRIASVDRGFFAFKPSNGFLLRLTEPAPRRWLPGVWWRMGTRVGIGGATSGKAARDMADIIALIKADPTVGLPADAPPDRPGE